MSTQIVYTRPLKTMILGFLGFGLAAEALAFAEKMGFIDAPLEKRAMGLIIGAVIIVIGNFLPKTHPLTAPGVNPPGPAAAAERFAGWTLFVVGIAYIALFALAPLDQARKISSVLGIGAMIFVAASWGWMLRGALLGGQEEESLADRQRAAKKRKLIVLLLFAFFYILATECMAFLLHNRSQIEAVSWWMFLGFGLLYSALMVVLNRKRCAH
jgi:hypothetical protein